MLKNSAGIKVENIALMQFSVQFSLKLNRIGCFSSVLYSQTT